MAAWRCWVSLRWMCLCSADLLSCMSRREVLFGGASSRRSARWTAWSLRQWRRWFWGSPAWVPWRVRRGFGGFCSAAVSSALFGGWWRWRRLGGGWLCWRRLRRLARWGGVVVRCGGWRRGVCGGLLGGAASWWLVVDGVMVPRQCTALRLVGRRCFGRFSHCSPWTRSMHRGRCALVGVAGLRWVRKAVVMIGGGGSTSYNDTSRNALAPRSCNGPWHSGRPRGGAVFWDLVVHSGAPRTRRGR